MHGFGQDPAQMAAQMACAAMSGQWNAEAMECQSGGQSYKVPDFQPDALPTGGCPSGQVQTPKGCFPYPGGDVVPNGGPTPPALPAPTTQTETPAWVLPTIIGVGALAVVALIVSSQK